MQQTPVESPARAPRTLSPQLRRLTLKHLRRPGSRRGALPHAGESLGGFCLEACLGSGTYGTVYRARRGDELYALKLLYLPLTGAWASRELEVLLRLQSVGLVKVDSHGHHRPWPGFGPLFLYIVTPYVDGSPLDLHVLQTPPNARQVCHWVLRLAGQLARAHSVGVVHRDLKPDNVVVRRTDGEPLLVDFGVGTYPGALTLTGALMPGSSMSRAPEAWRFRRKRRPGDHYAASPSDDLWALGVLFYWLLVGEWPFGELSDSEEELEDTVLHGRLEAPHERNPRVPLGLEAVCLRMLEKKPSARYPDAEAVGRALEQALAGADARWDVPLYSVPPASEFPRQREGTREAPTRKPVRRPRRARAGWTLGVLGLLGAVLGVLVLLPRSAPPPSAPLPDPLATPASWTAWMLSRPELTTAMCPLEGGAGGVSSPWEVTSAPVAFATHSKEGPHMKTSLGSAGTPAPRPQTVRAPIRRTLCTLALGAFATGCPGAQVRADPKPEACPEGSLEAMKRLNLEPGQWAILGEFASPLGSHPGPIPVQDRSIIHLFLHSALGGLETRSMLTGRVLFGRERVFIQFIEARRRGGEVLPICMEALESDADKEIGLVPDPSSTPDSMKVMTYPNVRVVERFE